MTSLPIEEPLQSCYFVRKYSVAELSAVGSCAIVPAPRLLTSPLLDTARLANGLWTTVKTANGLNAPELPGREKKQTV